MRLIAFFLMIFIASSHAFADDQRTENLFKVLRCPTCESQSIASSQSEAAADMRSLVREFMAEGLSDEQIIERLERSYGASIHLKPPMRADTALLWLLPFMIFLGGLGALVIKNRKANL